MDDLKLRVVKLIEPALCLGCRFVSKANTELPDGTVTLMIHCKRLDCDNWETEKDEINPVAITEVL